MLLLVRTEAASDLLEAAAAANPLEDSIEDRSLGSRMLLETKEDLPPPLTTDSFLLANCSSSSLRAAAAAAVGFTAISNREERGIRWCLGGAGVWRADGEKEIFGGATCTRRSAQEIRFQCQGRRALLASLEADGFFRLLM